MRALLCVVAACAVVPGCGGDEVPATEIVLTIVSDLSVPGEIDRLSIDIAGLVEATSASADLTTKGLPRTLGISHDDGPLGPITITAAAWLGPSKVVERVAAVSFLRNKSLSLTIALSSACVSVSCGNSETCVDGACETPQSSGMTSVAVGVTPGAELADSGTGGDITNPGDGMICDDDCSSMDDQCNVGECKLSNLRCEMVPANQGGDCDDGMFCTENDTCQDGVCAGSDRDCSSADVGDCMPGVCNEQTQQCETEAIDEGKMCAPSAICLSGVCTAQIGCGAGQSCSPDCSSDCTIKCSGAINCDARCRTSGCNIDCTGVENCNARCDSDCNIDCTNADNCQIECDGSCVVECTGANDCSFTECDGSVLNCDDGIIVCDRSCP